MNNQPNQSSEMSALKLGNEEKEQDFYRDLDKKKSHQSCCTCQTLVLFFMGVLVVFFGLIFFVYWQVTHGGILNFNTPTATIQDFQKKLDNVSLNPNGEIKLNLTSNELNAILTGGISIQNFVLKDIVLSINPDNILIYGSLIKPISSKVVITTIPVVKNEKLSLHITKITAGKMDLPNFLNNRAEDGLNNLLDAKMAPFYQKATVNKVELSQDKIIITANPK